MELAVGTIISGKVTAITKFGAFVSLPGGKSGLVHISEVNKNYSVYQPIVFISFHY